MWLPAKLQIRLVSLVTPPCFLIVRVEGVTACRALAGQSAPGAACERRETEGLMRGRSKPAPGLRGEAIYGAATTSIFCSILTHEEPSETRLSEQTMPSSTGPVALSSGALLAE